MQCYFEALSWLTSVSWASPLRAVNSAVINIKGPYLFLTRSIKYYGIVVACTWTHHTYEVGEEKQQSCLSIAAAMDLEPNLMITFFIWSSQHLYDTSTALILLVWGVKLSQSFGKSWNPTPRQLLRGGSQRRFCLSTKTQRRRIAR